jgi:uncharacterized protein involved in exopolysaccharide biosynthesis
MEPSQELDIKRYLQLVYKKRYVFIIAAVSIITATVVAGYLLPPMYEAKTVVLIERNFIKQLIKDITVMPSLDERVKVLSLVMKSRSLLLKVIGDLDLDVDKKSQAEIEKMVRNFQDKTEIRIEINKANRKDMDSFAVLYQDRDPKRSMDYVNMLVRRYIEENLSATREEAYGANRFISEQIDFFKSKIDAVEGEIANYKKDKGVATHRRIRALQRKVDDLSVQYTENHPEVIKAKAEIEALQDQLRQRSGNADPSRDADAGTSMSGTSPQESGEGQAATESALAALAAKNERLKAVIESQRALLRTVPAGNKKLPDLEHERDAYGKIYEELVASRGKSEVSTQVEVQNKSGTFRIVDAAVLPTKPINDRVKMILLGIGGGFAGALLLVLLLDYLDDSVKTVDALRGLGVPVLAIIPSIQNVEELAERKKKDVLVYSAAGVYLLGVLALLARELLIS